MITYDICKKNGRFVSIFLFQYTVLIPLMIFISPTLLITVSGIMIMIVMLFYNRKCKINMKPLILGMGVLLILLLKAFQGGLDLISIFYVVAIIGPVIIIFLYPFDYQTFIGESIKWAKISFWLICWYPFVDSFEYMRFGYGMLPVVIFTYIDLVFVNSSRGKNRREIRNRIYDIILIGIATLEIVFYGARGAIVAVALFVLLERFFISRKRIVLNSFIVIVIGIILIYIVPILDFLEMISQKIGIYSYSLRKLKMQISMGIAAASSGRDILYQNATEKIKEHPFTGNSMSIDESGGDYSHNLFLQVGQDLGIVALIVLVVFLIYVLVMMWRNKTDIQEKIIYIALFSASVGRLIFSSTLWRRPEFWMLVCFTMVAKRNRKILSTFQENH